MMRARLVATLACAGLAACATSSPAGGGRYLQILNAQKAVVAEFDTGSGGQMPCKNQLHFVLQARPSTIARCSDSASTDALPYSFVAHNQSAESDGLRPSSPYLVRASTAELCAVMRNSTARPDAKVKIIQDHCGAARARP